MKIETVFNFFLSRQEVQEVCSFSRAIQPQSEVSKRGTLPAENRSTHVIQGHDTADALHNCQKLKAFFICFGDLEDVRL